jgi:hypothetical protein
MRRLSSRRIFMSASLARTDWKLDSGWPSCIPSFACATARSNRVCISPIHGASAAARSHNRARRSTPVSPAPGSPRMLVLGTSQPSSTTSARSAVRSPRLTTGAPTESPGVVASTRNADTPFGPRSGSVTAVTMKTAATGAFTTIGTRPCRRHGASWRCDRAPTVDGRLTVSAVPSAKAPTCSPRQRDGR